MFLIAAMVAVYRGKPEPAPTEGAAPEPSGPTAPPETEKAPA